MSQRKVITVLIKICRKTVRADTKKQEEIKNNLLNLYFQSGITPDDLKIASERLDADIQPNKTEGTNQQNTEEQIDL